MSFTGHTVLDAAQSPITTADKTDEAPETGAKQEDVDTATTSNYSKTASHRPEALWKKKDPKSPKANQTVCKINTSIKKSLKLISN